MLFHEGGFSYTSWFTLPRYLIDHERSWVGFAPRESYGGKCLILKSSTNVSEVFVAVGVILKEVESGRMGSLVLIAVKSHGGLV